MTDLTPTAESGNFLSTDLITLAREIAIGHWGLEEILKRNSISEEQWEQIKNNKVFNYYLEQQVSEWNSVTNTNERVKFKSAAILEFYLEEAHQRLHDPKESLAPKVELAKFVGRLAGMGVTGMGVNDTGGGSKLTVTINLGNDSKLTFEKDIPPKVIEHEDAA